MQVRQILRSNCNEDDERCSSWRIPVLSIIFYSEIDKTVLWVGNLNRMVQRKIIVLTLSIISILSVIRSHGQAPDANKITVSGTVLDSATHQPLEFVAVAVLDTQEKNAIGTTTSADGTFTFGATVLPDYLLRITYMGYQVYKRKIVVTQTTTNLDLGIILLQAESMMLNEVVISSTKSQIRNEGEKIIYNAASDISNTSGSAADVLSKAPLVTVDSEGNVKVRGNSNIRVLLNGLPSGFMAQNLKEALKMIPANSIESIEVITSPSAKYEAEGAAGIINIITKRTANTSGNFNISHGNLDQSATMNLNIVRKKFTYSITADVSKTKRKSLSELRRQSFHDGTTSSTLYQRNQSLERSAGGWGGFNMEYHPDTLQTFSAGISYWTDSWPVESSLYNIYGSSLGSREYNQVSIQSGKFRYADLSFNYIRKFQRKGQELKFANLVGHSNGRMEYVTNQDSLNGIKYFSERSPNKSDDWDYNSQLDYTHPLNKSGTSFIETGGRWSRTTSVSKYAVYNNSTSTGSEDLHIILSRSDTMRYYQNIMAAYVSVTIGLKNDWVIRPGARYERTGLGGSFKGSTPSFNATFGNFVPNFLVTRQFNSHHDGKLSYTERIRRPWIWDMNPYVNASDPLNLTFGNPLLRPEVTRTLEIGHGYMSDSGFSLNSTVYGALNRNAIEQLTTVDSVGVSRSTWRNVATNERLGASINGSVPVNNKWVLNASVEFYHVWFKSQALSVSNQGNYVSTTISSTYTLPKGFAVQVAGNFDNGNVTLQGRQGANYNYRFTAKKEIFKNKGTISIALNNIFKDGLSQRSYATSPGFDSDTKHFYYNRSFAISLSWRLGRIQIHQRNDGDDENEERTSGGKRHGG